MAQEQPVLPDNYLWAEQVLQVLPAVNVPEDHAAADLLQFVNNRKKIKKIH